MWDVKDGRVFATARGDGTPSVVHVSCQRPLDKLVSNCLGLPGSRSQESFSPDSLQHIKQVESITSWKRYCSRKDEMMEPIRDHRLSYRAREAIHEWLRPCQPSGR